MPIPLLQPPPCFLRWRDELAVTRAGQSDAEGYLIEDPVTGKFHRLGRRECLIAMQLDGSTTLAVCAANAAQQNPTLQLSPESLEALERWLLSSGLVEAWIQGQRRTLSLPTGDAASQSILCWRVSLGSPDRWLRHVTPWLSWLFTWPAVLVGLVLMLVALVAVAVQGRSFTHSLDLVWHPDQHWRLLLCWLILKVFHELGHGVACQRFGGEVREWGVTFMYFAPVPYVDVTSSWRMTSRWQRIAIAAGGMYLEWLIAVIAVAAWFVSDDSAVQQSAVYIASLASVSTLLFNANPLFRFDGYFILTDLIHWPNLSTQGQLLSKAWLRRWWLGTPPASVALSPRATQIATLYGLAAWAWRTFMVVSMSILAIVMYDAIGILLVGFMLLTGFVQPWLRTRKKLATLPGVPTTDRRHFWRRAALTAVALIVVGCLPWWGSVTAPGIVQPIELTVVRTPAKGFVAELHIVDGQSVAAGQVLAVLRNEALVVELEQLEQSERLGEVRVRAYRQRRELVAMQAEEGKLIALREQLADQRRKVDALTIRAPQAGRVIGRQLDDLPGSYLNEGAELCAITGDELEVLLAIADYDLSAFRDKLGTTIEVSLPGGRRSGRLTSVDPRATRQPHDPALVAPLGGPLPAVKKSTEEQANDAGHHWELLRPHFVGHVTLAAIDEPPLGIGQRATAQFRPFDHRVFDELARGWDRWLDQMRAEHGAQ